MKRTTKYVAFDVHQATTVASVRDDSGRVLARSHLKELTRTYRNLVEDGTRVMLRIKALFRARAIPTPGTAVYQAKGRAQWLEQLTERGVRFRAVLHPAHGQRS